MSCTGLHCGGCGSSGSGGGGSRLLGVLVAAGVGVFVLHGGAGAVVDGLEASTAAANEALAVAFAVILVLAVVAGAGWVVFACRRRRREEQLLAEFQAQLPPSATGPARLTGRSTGASNGRQRLVVERLDRHTDGSSRTGGRS